MDTPSKAKDEHYTVEELLDTKYVTCCGTWAKFLIACVEMHKTTGATQNDVIPSTEIAG